jgi:hypothetical protein
MLDVKQKLKLLAIEEEIARLELELYREGGAYLGTKSEEDMDTDRKAFQEHILNTVIEELKQTYKDKMRISMAEVDKSNIPSLIGHDPSLHPKTPKKKTTRDLWQQATDFARKAVSKAGKAANHVVNHITGESTRIEYAWKIALNTTSVTVLMAFKPDDMCYFCIYKSDELNKKQQEDLSWESLWVTPGTGDAFFMDCKNKFKHSFDPIAQEAEKK